MLGERNCIWLDLEVCAELHHMWKGGGVSPHWTIGFVTSDFYQQVTKKKKGLRS